jgi:hypothetical protein
MSRTPETTYHPHFQWRSPIKTGILGQKLVETAVNKRLFSIVVLRASGGTAAKLTDNQVSSMISGQGAGSR